MPGALSTQSVPRKEVVSAQAPASGPRADWAEGMAPGVLVTFWL